MRGRQLLSFGLAIGNVVERLARHRRIQPERLRGMAELGNLPRAMVRQSVVAQFARLDQIVERTHRFFDRRLVVFAMDVEQIDVIGVQALQAGIDGTHDVFARCTACVDIAAIERIGELGGEHPAFALRGDAAAHHALGFAFAVDIRGIDRIDALLVGLIDDARGGCFVGRAAEHHRSER